MFDRMVYPDPYFLIFKTKKQPHFFSEVRGCFFDPILPVLYPTEGICDKFIEIKIYVGCTWFSRD